MSGKGLGFSDLDAIDWVNAVSTLTLSRPIYI